MPRFHFDGYDGHHLPDMEGTDLPDVHAARLEAIAAAGELIRDTAKQSKIDEEWRMEGRCHGN
jgi:hypothetical protein